MGPVWMKVRYSYFSHGEWRLGTKHICNSQMKQDVNEYQFLLKIYHFKHKLEAAALVAFLVP